MKRNGASQKEIAAAIGTHPSTVCREIRRAI
jgi:IS30 family transposase